MNTHWRVQTMEFCFSLVFIASCFWRWLKLAHWKSTSLERDSGDVWVSLYLVMIGKRHILLRVCQKKGQMKNEASVKQGYKILIKI